MILLYASLSLNELTRGDDFNTEYQSHIWIHLMLQHHPGRRYQNTLSLEDPRQTPKPLAYDKRTNHSNWLSV